MPLIQGLPVIFVSLYDSSINSQNHHKQFDIKVLNVHKPMIKQLPCGHKPKEPLHYAGAILKGHLL